ncbi:hypothetical protein RND71_015737 [Anisodus tanguticus]|uniref:Uncharacterized protein n=1 Tax=Anisodus tanguticus TaxID=243964 RepID=A0AAE1S4T9_9SOLA|nr:hypothetical protein RND71_015737 [Anisodus tanguticus]
MDNRDKNFKGTTSSDERSFAMNPTSSGDGDHNSVVETDGDATQVSRKLLFSNDSAANAQDEPRRNNRAPNRPQTQWQAKEGPAKQVTNDIAPKTDNTLPMNASAGSDNVVQDITHVQVNQVEHVNKKGKKKVTTLKKRQQIMNKWIEDLRIKLVTVQESMKSNLFDASLIDAERDKLVQLQKWDELQE